MRTNLYVVMALALSSCAGKGFMKQKYTRFAHNHHRQEKSILSSNNNTGKPEAVKYEPVSEQNTASTAELACGGEKTSQEPLPKEKPPAKKEVVSMQGMQELSAHSTLQKKTTAVAAKQAGFPHMTPFEEFMLGLFIIFIFFILPAAFIMGIVWMFFNLWLGVLIAGSAVFIFGLILLLALTS